MDCACAIVAGGRRLRVVSQALNVSRAQLSVRVHRKPGWRDGRHHRQYDDVALAGRIMEAIAELPSHGYCRVWALLRRQSEATRQPVVNAKRVYRVMRDHGLLLERKPAAPLTLRAHKGHVAVKESKRRWCSDGFEFRCDNVMVKNYESRSSWTAVTGKPWTGLPVPGVTTMTLCKMLC